VVASTWPTPDTAAGFQFVDDEVQQTSVPICVTAQKMVQMVSEQDSESTVSKPGMSVIAEVSLVDKPLS
jgi:hypothetical protein